MVRETSRPALSQRSSSAITGCVYSPGANLRSFRSYNRQYRRLPIYPASCEGDLVAWSQGIEHDGLIRLKVVHGLGGVHPKAADGPCLIAILPVAKSTFMTCPCAAVPDRGWACGYRLQFIAESTSRTIPPSNALIEAILRFRRRPHHNSDQSCLVSLRYCRGHFRRSGKRSPPKT